MPRELTKPLLHGLPSYLPPPHPCHPSEPNLRNFPWDVSVVFPLIVVPRQGPPTLLMSALVALNFNLSLFLRVVQVPRDTETLRLGMSSGEGHGRVSSGTPEAEKWEGVRAQNE